MKTMSINRERSFAYLKPHASELWDYEKNDGVRPIEVTAQSNKKFWFRCKKDGHPFDMSPSKMKDDEYQCPYDAHWHPRILEGYNDLKTLRPDVAAWWAYDLNKDLKRKTPEEYMPGSNIVVWWRCPNNPEHVWKSSVENRTNQNSGCPICCGNRVGNGNSVKDLYPSILQYWSPNNDIRPAEALKSRKVIWICPNGHEYKAKAEEVYNRTKLCPICSHRKSYKTFKETYPGEADLWDYEKNEDRPEDLSSDSRRMRWFLCAQHGHSFYAETTRFKPSYCPVKDHRFPDIGMNDLETSDPKRAAEWDYDKNIPFMPKLIRKDSKDYYWWICSADGMSYFSPITGECPACKSKERGGVRLFEGRPDLEKYWDYENNKIDPEEVFTTDGGVFVRWRCPKADSHRWTASTSDVLRHKTYVCPYCAGKIKRSGINDFKTLYPELANLWDKSNTMKAFEVFPGDNRRFSWICKHGHITKETLKNKISNPSCPQCPVGIRREESLAYIDPDLARQWDWDRNPDFADGHYGPEEFRPTSEFKADWICPRNKSHRWNARIHHRSIGEGCPLCWAVAQSSAEEKELRAVIETAAKGRKVMANDRSTIPAGELDIYVPEMRKAFEFNGVYWHLEKNTKGRSYHYDKWRKCHDRGIFLYMVWEDDWREHKATVINLVRMALGDFDGMRKIPSYGYHVEQRSAAEVRSFFKKNCIAGWDPSELYMCAIDNNDDSCILAGIGFNLKNGKAIVGRYAVIEDTMVSGVIRYMSAAIVGSTGVSALEATFPNASVLLDMFKMSGFKHEEYIPYRCSCLIDGKRLPVDTKNNDGKAEKIWDEGSERLVFKAHQ